jgi:outer membrane protein W
MMKKTILMIFIASIFNNDANCQITKGNWLIGGSGQFQKQHEDLQGSDIRGLAISVAPDIGYFIFDKLGVGLNVTFSYNRIKVKDNISKTNILGLGPFVRYYFLPSDNRINIFSEAAYEYTTVFDGHYQNDFYFSAGPVIFFNSSVGLELAAKYSTSNSKISNATAKTVFLTIGFQIHLEKLEQN